MLFRVVQVLEIEADSPVAAAQEAWDQLSEAGRETQEGEYRVRDEAGEWWAVNAASGHAWASGVQWALGDLIALPG
jgi:hypothetical protein